MTKLKYYSAFAVISFLLFTSLHANAAYLVYPDDPYWTFDNRSSNGTAVISAQNPRGYLSDDGWTWIDGNASLALTTSDSGDDWAFYTRYAGDTGHNWDGSSSYGSLSNINDLSFDWYRVNSPIKNPDYKDSYWGAPWRAQTPVLRLLIQDGGIMSELVWEKWYSNTDETINGIWHEEDLIGQNFWRHLISYDAYTIDDGTNITPYEHYQALMTFTSSGLASSEVNYPYSNEAVIYGLSVGVGSAWYDVYSGFVDNIYLSFNNSGIITTALNDNFELPVPEPATLVLFGSGIGIMALGRRWHKKRTTCEG